MSITKAVESVEVADSKIMSKALELVAERFNLGEDYYMTAFKASKGKVQVTLTNETFEVTTTIKDIEVLYFDEVEADE